MSSKRTEFGRSLVETLAVLVVIAILLLAGLVGYNFTIHKYKKDQTVKAISELAVRYKLHPISTTGAVNIKSIYPEAERADAVNMKTADIETGRVRLEVSEDNSYFAVVVNSILDDSCKEYLEKGEYDAALLLNGETYNSKTDTEYLAFGKDFLKDFDLSKLTAEQRSKLSEVGLSIDSSKKEVINVICSGSTTKTAALVFGDKCPKRGASHYYNGKCWPCPHSQKEDRYGVCCSEDQINSKESCYSCRCPSGTHCDGTGPDATGQCVECLDNDDCKEAGKTRCDKERHVCVQCTEEGGCGKDENNCPTHCNLKTHTCSDGCDTAQSWWKLSDGVCVCEKTLQEGEECSTTCGPNCCATGLTCHADSQRCCPTDLPEYNDLCVAGCGCNSDAHLVCNSGNRCVCDESNDYYWDGSQCKKGCRFNTLYHVDDPIGTCGICQENGNIALKPGVDSNCCNSTTWELMSAGTPVDECGICQTNGTVGQDTTKTKPNQCYNDCDTTPGSSTIWRFVLKNAGKDVECSPECCATGKNCVNGNTCCTGNGAYGADCSDNAACCASGLSCNTSKKCDCPSGYTWVEEEGYKKCCPADKPHIDKEGNCSECVYHVQCATSWCSDGSGCNGNQWCRQGHCCPSGHTWVEEEGYAKCCPADKPHIDKEGNCSECVYHVQCSTNLCSDGSGCNNNQWCRQGHCCSDWSGQCRILHNMQAVHPSFAQHNGTDGVCCDTVIDSVENVAFKGTDCAGQMKGCCWNDHVSNGHCCPEAGQVWNGTTCETPCVDLGCGCGVACPTNCIHLYQYKATRTNGQGKDEGECCEPNQKLVTKTANTLFQGYKADPANTTKYGCCPANKVAGQSCCSTSQTPVAGACCATNKVYTENGVQKCCNGTVYANGTKCCTGTGYFVKNDTCVHCPTLSTSFDFRYSDRIKAGTYELASLTVPCDATCSYSAQLSLTCVDDALMIYKNGSKIGTASICGNDAFKCPAASLIRRCGNSSYNLSAGDTITVKLYGLVSPHEGLTAGTGSLTLTPQ